MIDNTCSDAQLTELILSGDRDAFSLLVSRFHRIIYSIAYRMAGNATEAEDLCQEIFLRIYQNLALYDKSMPLAPWIRRLACNHTLNWLKRRSHAPAALSVEIDGQELERLGITYILQKTGSDWTIAVMVLHDSNRELRN